MEYKKCLVEVDEVLERIVEEDLKKIPKEILDSIREQKDQNYLWKYDVTKPLSEQKLDRKTIAILSYLNMEYMLDSEQKALMKRIHEMNEQESEKEKREKYSPDNIFEKDKPDKPKTELMVVVQKKEKWYMRLWNFIKTL